MMTLRFIGLVMDVYDGHKPKVTLFYDHHGKYATTDLYVCEMFSKNHLGALQCVQVILQYITEYMFGG